MGERVTLAITQFYGGRIESDADVQRSKGPQRSAGSGGRVTQGRQASQGKVAADELLWSGGDDWYHLANDCHSRFCTECRSARRISRGLPAEIDATCGANCSLLEHLIDARRPRRPQEPQNDRPSFPCGTGRPSDEGLEMVAGPICLLHCQSMAWDPE